MRCQFQHTYSVLIVQLKSWIFMTVIHGCKVRFRWWRTFHGSDLSRQNAESAYLLNQRDTPKQGITCSTLICRRVNLSDNIKDDEQFVQRINGKAAPKQGVPKCYPPCNHHKQTVAAFLALYAVWVTNYPTKKNAPQNALQSVTEGLALFTGIFFRQLWNGWSFGSSWGQTVTNRG